MKTYNSLAEVQSDLFSDVVSCTEITQAYINRINEKKHLNAFVEVFEASALEQAKLVDQQIKNKTSGKLAGMVIAIKDNICYKDHGLSGSSKILEGFNSLFSATVVERLLAEDAIIVGRTNCDEFAMGSSNENSAFGNVLNPHNEKCVPGGSSGGSAAAVAADLCLAALGTDTGGSIRQPASFCGVIGLKPSYGRVSRHGAIAYASSFDQIGPIAKNIDDVALILEVVAGSDEHDSTVSSEDVPEYPTLINTVKEKYKIAYIKDTIEHDGLDAEIKDKINTIIDTLGNEGQEVSAVDFPYVDYMVPAYYVLTTAEASSNLARYDGVHFGARSKSATDLESVYKKTRSENFGLEVKRRIMLGTFVLSSGYYDAYYSKAQKVRRLLRDKTNAILESHDFIIMPTTPSTAFKIGQKKDDPLTMYLEDIYTVQANITGIPAISLPLGKHSNGMPFGVQLISKKFSEAELMSFSKYLMDKF